MNFINLDLYIGEFFTILKYSIFIDLFLFKFLISEL